MTDNLAGIASIPTGPGAGIATARVIIADDHRVLAEGLRTLLEPTYTVVGMAHSGTDLLPILRTAPADCLLLDLMMPGQNGFSLLPLIRRIQPALKIVVLTMLVDRVIAEACLRAGADAFVPKDADGEEVLDAISTVLAGKRYLSPRVPKTSHHVGLAAARPGLEGLTPRQYAILRLLSSGKRPAHIAEDLGVSRSTVTFHIQNLMRVLGVPTTDALLQWAVLTAPPPRNGARLRWNRTARGEVRRACCPRRAGSTGVSPSGG
jgi:DNA-binding NarL/FixJ family response regulator